MLEQRSIFVSDSYSYFTNYKIQSNLYDWFDKKTEDSDYLVSAGIAMWSVSNLISSIARVSSIVEVLFKGLAILFSAPFTDQKIQNIKIGLHEVFVHAPKNILRAICLPLEFLVGSIFIGVEAKFFTMHMIECSKINLLHAQNGTLHSDKHQKDLDSISGIVKVKFMKYQKKKFNL